MAIQDQINRITNEVGTQSDLIEQIKSALYGKAVGNKQEQTKEVVITDNGNYSIEPDEGYTLSGVDVSVDVQDDPNSKALFYYEDYDEEGYPHTLVITQSIPSNTIENGRTIPKLFATHYYGYLGINAKVNKVVLPDDVTVLDNTLMISYAIDEVDGWDNLVYIGNNSFYDCEILKTMPEFPPNLTWLGNSAFDRCDVRDDMPLLPNSVTNIGDCCFIYSYSGAPIVAFGKLPENLVTIGTKAFYNNGFGLFPEIVHIPASVRTIGGAAFAGAICNTKTIVFDGTPETIGADSFNDLKKTTGIKDIYVPWVEGAVANAPWGATNATIHYNTQYDADGNPITE